MNVKSFQLVPSSFPGANAVIFSDIILVGTIWNIFTVSMASTMRNRRCLLKLELYVPCVFLDTYMYMYVRARRWSDLYVFELAL